MNIVERCISVIAPHECVGCGMEGTVLCTTCCASLPALPSVCYRCGVAAEASYTCKSCRKHTSLERVWAATCYNPTAKTVVHSLKFARAQAAAADLAREMGRKLQLNGEWLVVHVPTANARVRARGYDQAKLIALALARQRGWRHSNLLARQTSSRQVGKQREVRRKQMDGAFRPVRAHAAKSANILLVDDVLTTGATLEAAATTLKLAGANRICAVVFAKA